MLWRQWWTELALRPSAQVRVQRAAGNHAATAIAAIIAPLRRRPAVDCAWLMVCIGAAAALRTGNGVSPVDDKAWTKQLVELPSAVRKHNWRFKLPSKAGSFVGEAGSEGWSKAP